MAKTYEKPKVTQTPRPGGGIEETWEHPAYATIHAHRVSGGGGNLFASNVGHTGHMRITVHPARMHRDGYSENIFGGAQTLMEVEMTEAQWVAFISRPNMGSGTPCTLNRVATGPTVSVPGIDFEEKIEAKLESQIEEMLRSGDTHADEAAQKLRDLLLARLPKNLHKDFESLLGQVVGHGKRNRDFQKKCLTETKEKLSTEMAIEFEALVTSTVTKLGMSSLQQLNTVLAADPDQLVKLLGSEKTGE